MERNHAKRSVGATEYASGTGPDGVRMYVRANRDSPGTKDPALFGKEKAEVGDVARNQRRECNCERAFLEGKV
jgi:hypothetical protein